MLHVNCMSDPASARTGSEAALAGGGFERLHHADLAALTYEAIRKRILLRELRTGEQIPVEAVAARLGVSRTPVIDALKRLENEGLVEIRARRGSFVRGLTANDIREVFEIREAVELFSVRMAVRERRHVALADALAQIAGPMAACTADDEFIDYDRFIEWDRAFHAAIVHASGNGRMEALYRNLHVHLHIMRVHYFRELESASRVNADHSEILGAVRAGDLRLAERALSNHLLTICNLAISHLRDGGSL
jgi:DNA-binding GntR family transcriptional regulator